MSADGFLSALVEYDKDLLLSLNGSDSLYLDRVMRVLTATVTWVPLYISLFYVVLNNNDNFRKVMMILCGAGLCVLLAGTVDDMIVKPMVGRWRPTHDPEIGLLVDIVDGYRGGRFGFFSAHASNTFSIAVFFCWLVRSRLLSLALILWSFTNCWTRLYLGVHFPGDILVGLLWGGLVGSTVYFLYYRLSRNMTSRRRFISSQYTSTGFQRSDCDVPVAVLVFTLVFALIKSCLI
ncbi:undecaprenyl-diphosphatase [Prevotella aff. ruminicola Tc2-24]|uniref:Undecaprenyl-diphosphatase n=2 Tax=Prevotellaceae TaxID=171552 RepID=A0A1I0MAS0_9BACT|nr:undecaprenyl-diphosphatase [Prevotella sp. lc2012]SEV85218.1 undecaprenyl-diphosphatase [Prevotella aff. ruminicola Tc2-24]